MVFRNKAAIQARFTFYLDAGPRLIAGLTTCKPLSANSLPPEIAWAPY